MLAFSNWKPKTMKVEFPFAQLHLGDCREILPNIMGDIDLIITDPPYGVGLNTKNGSRGRGNVNYFKGGRVSVDHSPIFGDDEPFDPSPLLQARRCVIWGANHFADRLPPSRCWFSWDRNCGRAGASDSAQCELAWTCGLPYRANRVFRHMWDGYRRDSETGQKHLHPTQKPVALMEWCISFFPGDGAVCDPFMGSGPVGVACANLGRRFIGIEIEPAYFDISCRRIEAAHAQMPLPLEAMSHV